MTETVLPWISTLCKVCIAAGLVNVWLLRFNRATKYRGAGAQTMKEEFAAYGLPAWSLYMVGSLKLAIAAVMLVVLFNPHLMLPLGAPALGLLAILMLGAITMHIKVRDSLIKALPACLMLAMTSAILVISLQ